MHSQSNKHSASYDDYQEAFGEPASHTLDLDTWVPGEDILSLYATLEQEVREAVQEEEGRQGKIRKEVFPKIKETQTAAPGAGLYKLTPDVIEKAHRGFLFNGAVEAADGTMAIHDTLPVTITQVGVCLVSYNGTSGSYAHRLFRKDLRARDGGALDKLIELLKRRQQRGAIGNEMEEPFGTLFTRGVMAWAERAFLLERSNARWRMGHGNPTPYELLVGLWADKAEMVDTALDVMTRLVEYRQFVYVLSAPSQREYLTLGYALHPLEYLVLTTHEDYFDRMIETGKYHGENKKKIEAFAREVGPQIVLGLYRVSRESPPHLFYAHRDYVHEAATIAMADGALQMHRGFPMLIDLADRLCRATLGSEDFLACVRLAYGSAGRPYSYQNERDTRA